MQITQYEITYDYYDKRHYRRSRTITCSNIDNAVKEIQNLKQKMGQIGGPIELPQVVMIKNGEIKSINNLQVL